MDKLLPRTEKEDLQEDIKNIIHDLRNAELDLKEAIRWRDNRKERLASLRNQLKALKE